MKMVGEQGLDCSAPSSRPAFVLLGEALVAIDKYTPVIDVMVQQQPFVVNLVWGGIRFTISVSWQMRSSLETTFVWVFRLTRRTRSSAEL